MSTLSGHTEIISLVERIVAVIEHGHWYTSNGYSVELSMPDRASLNGLRDELNALARKAAEASSDDREVQP